MIPDIQWVEVPQISIPQEFQEAIGGHPLVAEALYRRGIRTLAEARAFLDSAAHTPASPNRLPDAQLAYDLLTRTIREGGRILVWGDFDVDGQTATTILVEALLGLNADVRFHIPVRGEESHGISVKVIQNYLQQGFDLLVTCDTGITAHEALHIVKDAGIPVIVTDHHTPGDTLPPADAIVNPQRLPEDHPLRTLPGVGVTCLLMQGLYQHLSIPFDQGHYLELAALGIVADVAALAGDTRYLLQRGLDHLRQSQRVGLQTLFQNADLNPANLSEGHIGFQIAPRLNAVGRLGDANQMVEFLTTSDPGRARVLGAKIEALNSQRRFLTRQVEQAAEQQLRGSVDDRHAPAIVLHHPDWPAGVVGIVAGRLAERYHKPTIVLTGQDPVHGSARSIPGINITEAIGAQADLLTGYGGHPMAAGLSLPADALSQFKRGFLSTVGNRLQEPDLSPEIRIHRTLTLPEISIDLVHEIQRLAPFGECNPPLNFLIRDLRLVSARDVGQTGEHRQVTAADAQGNEQTFIWWNGSDEPLPEADFDLICQLSLSDYKGARQISAEWIAFRHAASATQPVRRRQAEWQDERAHPFPIRLLEELRSTSADFQVWVEGTLLEGLPGRDRHHLAPTQTLAIWTAPPSQKVLQDAIAQVDPDKIILIGQDPAVQSYQEVMARVGGLAKHVINSGQGVARLIDLAAACATTQQAIRIALDIWQAMGKFQIDFEDEDQVSFKNDPGLKPDYSVQKMLEETLRTHLDEIRAYRRFFAKAEPTQLLSQTT